MSPSEGANGGAGAGGAAAAAPKGVYMHGGVGTGKTFLMDLFFQEAPVASKRRVHFLDFMMDVHQRMHRCRQRGLSGEGMVSSVIDELLEQGWLLCFDEMQVTDIADAMMMRMLFAGLWARGAVVVATSNRPPRHLYHQGLQREQFVPFIQELERRTKVHSLEDSPTDYRLLKGASAVKDVYLHPATPGNAQAMDKLWQTLSHGAPIVSVRLSCDGREVHVPRAVHGSRLAYFTFAELCGKPLGAADYRVMAEAFPTLFLAGVPKMDLSHINQVRRFITLVDVLYERGVKLVCLASAAPAQLFHPGRGERSKMPDEVFAFDRTVSRLVEMQGQDYLGRCWHPSGSEFLVQFSGEKLSDEDLMKIWHRYDLDQNGQLDRDEMRAIMEDLCEAKNGHRNVPQEAVDATFAAMDRKGHGYVSLETFMHFGRRFGMAVWWGSGETPEDSTDAGTRTSNTTSTSTYFAVDVSQAA